MEQSGTSHRNGKRSKKHPFLAGLIHGLPEPVLLAVAVHGRLVEKPRPTRLRFTSSPCVAEAIPEGLSPPHGLVRKGKRKEQAASRITGGGNGKTTAQNIAGASEHDDRFT